MANNIIQIQGEDYEILGKKGNGGEAQVYKIRHCATKKEYAYKHLIRNKTEKKKANIQKIIDTIVPLEHNGVEIKEFILPQVLVSHADGTFGYLMELVPDGFYNVESLWTKKVYPSDDVILKIIYNISTAFYYLGNIKGKCYKDINLENIMVNPETGEVRIIDTDNIGLKTDFTILGTPGFLAPEIYNSRELPDYRTDQHSLAIWLFYLLLGDHPLDGRLIVEYSEKNNMLYNNCLALFHGRKPLFIFDDSDRSNNVIGMDNHKSETEIWSQLPAEIRELFKKSFGAGLKIREKRASFPEWRRVGSNNSLLAENECPGCGRKHFSSRRKCNHCNHVFSYVRDDMETASKNVSVVLKRLIANGGKITEATNMMLTGGMTLSGKDLFSSLELEKSVLELCVDPYSGKVGIKNKSSFTIEIRKTDKTITKIPPEKSVEIEEKDVLKIIPDKLYIEISKINGWFTSILNGNERRSLSYV